MTLPTGKVKLTLDSTDSRLVTYTGDDYDFVLALRGSELGVSEDVGKITFGTPAGTSDKVFAVLKTKKEAGTPFVCFFGTLTAGTAVDSTAAGLLKAVTSDLANAEDIKVGDFKSAGAISAYITLDVSKITVKGEANFLWTNKDVMGLLILSDIHGGKSKTKLTFEGTGTVSQ
ncbi:MAG: hypothetical protein LBJ20_00925 [Candidatus Methanoplasma sp.]|jgi:hypothetical protein|nr:hypothetical protein [Candidatus Methanoplasma sp.]